MHNASNLVYLPPTTRMYVNFKKLKTIQLSKSNRYQFGFCKGVVKVLAVNSMYSLCTISDKSNPKQSFQSCVCVHLLFRNAPPPPPHQNFGTQSTLLGLDVRIPVISFRIEAHNTFLCVWYYIWKNKIDFFVV